MNDNYNYPVGVDNQSAPWNERINTTISTPIYISQSLSKDVDSFVTDYTIIKDEDNQTYYDFTDTNIEEEYHNNDHYTPIQLIEMFKNYLQEEIKDSKEACKLSHASKSFIKHLIKECGNWVEDETNYQM